MKKSEFPNEMEWDKIVEEAFSSDDVHIFSEHYSLRKQQMLRRNNMTHKKFNKKRGIGLVVAAAVAAVAIPTTIFAYEKLTFKIEKTAKYENTITIQIPSDEEATAEQGYMDFELGWIPDGFEYNEQDGKYRNAETNGGITAIFYKLPDDTTVEISLPFSADCETYETEGKTAFINYREPDVYFTDNKFTREIFVTFGDTNYVLDLFITSDISQEDMYKFIDNINLVPTDEKSYGTYIPWLEDNKNKGQTNNSSATKTDKKNISEEKIRQFEENKRNIGDTISYPFNGEGTHSGYDITLNSVELTDSFEGIHTDGCFREWDYSDLMDENGNIVENIRTGIKYGDGVNTNDEIVSEEVVPIHIMKVNVTYTNTSDVEQEFCIHPYFFTFRDGVPFSDWGYDSENEIGYFDSVMGRSRNYEHFSLDAAPEYRGEKNYIVLEAGESADVQLAYFVDDELKDEVYLDFRVSGGGTSPVDFGEYFFIGQ